MAETYSLFHESEAGFKALFQYAPIGICLIRDNGCIEQINQYALKLFGYSAAELTGQPLEKVIPHIARLKLQDGNKEHIDLAENHPSEQGFTLWAVRKDGHQFPVEISVAHYRLNSQHLMIVYLTDITEKTLSDNKFKIVFYKSPAAKILSELETGKIVDTNDNFCRFSGYSREELIGKTPIDLGIISTDTHKQWMELLLNDGRISNLAIEIATKHSKQVFALLSAEQIEIIGKKFLLSTCINITEHKKANQALQLAKSLLEEEASELKRLNETGNRLWKINNLKDGLSEVLNSAIELTKADKGDIQLYNADKQVLVMDVSKGFSQKFLDYFREVNTGSLCTCGMALKKRAQVVTEDTEKEWGPHDAAIARYDQFRSAQSTPLLYRDGTPMGMISTYFKEPGSPPALALKKMELYALVAENFLERLKNYETIQRHNLELEEKIVERTKELIISLEHEKNLSDMKSRFVSIASHEFRTPLAIILSSIDLVKAYHLDGHTEKRDKHISRIESSVATLVDILNDFLSLDKLEQGKVETIYETFNLYELAEDLLEELNGIVKLGQQVRLSYEGQKEIVLDKKMIRNVLRNLLSNAIKYSDKGKEIALSIEILDNRVSMKIKDEGMGIPEEEQAYLFSTFFRAKNVTNIQGTGLGLSIVRKYVELLNGTISFSSKLNQGTTFIVTLPQNGY